MFGKGHLISGEKNGNFGNTGEKHNRTLPEYSQARWFFFLELHAVADIKQKRRLFLETFPDINKYTLWKWFRKWQAELESE